MVGLATRRPDLFLHQVHCQLPGDPDMHYAVVDNRWVCRRDNVGPTLANRLETAKQLPAGMYTEYLLQTRPDLAHETDI